MVNPKAHKRGAKRSKVNLSTNSSDDQGKLESSDMQQLLGRIAQLEGDIFDVVETNKLLRSDLERQALDLFRIEEELKRERARSDTLECTINNIEQYTRINNIRIFGMDDRNPKENAFQCEQRVLSLLSNKLGIKLKPCDIEIAHRIGRFQKDGNRPVIVRFINRKHKMECIRCRYRLKGQSEVIVEDLTSKNHEKLIKLKALECVKQAWTRDGKLYAVPVFSDSTVSIRWSEEICEDIFTRAPSQVNGPGALSGGGAGGGGRGVAGDLGASPRGGAWGDNRFAHLQDDATGDNGESIFDDTEVQHNTYTVSTPHNKLVQQKLHFSTNGKNN